MIQYMIFDSRYIDKPDRAICLSVCLTLKEAIEEAPEYGDDNVIVKATIKNNIIVKSEIKKIV